MNPRYTLPEMLKLLADIIETDPMTMRQIEHRSVWPSNEKVVDVLRDAAENIEGAIADDLERLSYDYY